MSVEALKEQARRYEQKEQWSKALDLYVQAISRLDHDQHPDISLYNRAGDLSTRVGNIEAAVEQYEKAVDLYVDAELPNNAIAICKKVIRNLPTRHTIYLKMGQIRAAQGFLTDARANFLAYAERMQGEGQIDEALRALIEFADLAPDDYEIRMALAAQFEQRERVEEAVEQLIQAHQVLTRRGVTEEADQVGAKVEELAPGTVIPPPGVPVVKESSGDGLVFHEPPPVGDDRPAAVEVGSDFSIDTEEASEAVEAAVEEASHDNDFGSFEIDTGGDAEEGSADEQVAAHELEDDDAPLPTIDFDDGEADDDAEEEDEGDEVVSAEDLEDDDSPLPMIEFDEGAADDDAGEEDGGDEVVSAEDLDDDDSPLPTIDFDDEAESDEEDQDEASEADEALEEAVEEAAVEARAEEAAAAPEAEAEHEALFDSGDVQGAIASLQEVIDADPDVQESHQRMVEYAFRLNDPSTMASAYLGLAQCLQRAGSEAQARAVFQQVLQSDPNNAEAKAALGEEAAAPEGEAGVQEVASSDDYVDLGSMLLGDGEKSTRMVVAYEEPTGDEEADFARMLSQFKDKVAENIDAGDVVAHYDLGTAYKEMGLIDEAIGEFQQALRASADHLPTYEMLGQTFIEKGELEAAVRSLTRALDTPYEIEDELLGIYYYLGLAHQEMGNTEQALEFYDRVFALDINFRDVTERLRALRG